MKLSEIISDLQKELQRNGDSNVLSYKVVTDNETTERFLISQNRIGKHGVSVRMTIKEFRQLIKRRKDAGLQ